MEPEPGPEAQRRATWGTSIWAGSSLVGGGPDALERSGRVPRAGAVRWRGEEGEAGTGCKAGSCRERGRGRPFFRNFRGSCYSARGGRAEWDAGPCGGLGPWPPPPVARRPCSTIPAHTDPVRRGRSAPPGSCYGRAASTPSCRRVTAAPSHCRNYPAPSYCGVCAGPAPPRRDFPPPSGGGGITPPPSRRRDAPGPGDCGFAPAPDDRLIPVARRGRSVPEAADSRRLPVAQSYSRDTPVAGDCRVSTGPGRWGGSGPRAFSGLPARSQAR